MSEKNFVAYGDAESILTGYANRIKQSPTTFVGTQAQWNALSSSQKAEYELVDITDDSLSPSGHVDWESNGEIGAKNLLENEKSTQTISGVTFTINSDGSVIADGTATDIIWFQINNGFKLNDVEYTLTGCPIGGGENTYEVQIRSTESSSSLWQFIIDRGDGATGLCSSSRTYIAFIGIKSGVTVTNLLFKPMLRLATDSDSTYQPYAMTNKELTKQVAPIDDMNNILGAKNLLPNHNVTQVIDGITFTVNNDGTVTATGTSTALVVFDVVNTELLSPFKLNSGTYILTDGLTASQYEGAYTALTLKYTDDTVEYNVADTSINKNQFTVDASTIKDWYFGICIRANKTVNITFKPMVRPASIKDDIYVPYSMTNKQLTDRVNVFNRKILLSSTVAPSSTGNWFYSPVISDMNNYDFILIKGKIGNGRYSIVWDLSLGSETFSVSDYALSSYYVDGVINVDTNNNKLGAKTNYVSGWSSDVCNIEKAVGYKIF